MTNMLMRGYPVKITLVTEGDEDNPRVMMGTLQDILYDDAKQERTMVIRLSNGSELRQVDSTMEPRIVLFDPVPLNHTKE